MKYLKRFEQLSNIEDNMCWAVDKTYRFDVVMFKLNMPQKNIDIFNSVLKSIKSDMIYIFYNKTNNWFTWDNICDRSNKYIKDEDYKYMGKLEITQKDIDDYELLKSVNNYNL